MRPHPQTTDQLLAELQKTWEADQALLFDGEDLLDRLKEAAHHIEEAVRLMSGGTKGQAAPGDLSRRLVPSPGRVIRGEPAAGLPYRDTSPAGM
jgi:hypothetical protein